MILHHIGYLAANLEKSRTELERLGFITETETIRDPGRGVDICFMLNGATRVELVSPSDKSSPLYPLLKRFKNAPYHFCYETGDMEGTIAELEREGYTVTQPPAPAPALGMRRVAFLLKGAVGLTELLEEETR